MRKPNNHFVRKEDLIYTPSVGLNDGLSGGLSAAAGDRQLAAQIMSFAQDIQTSEDNLRRSITDQQNKVLLLDAKNKLSQLNQTLYQNFQVDPDKFKLETNKKASEIINELPLLLREVAKESFVQEQNDYYYKALNNQREYLDRQTFEQTQLNIQNLAKSASSSVIGLFNPNLMLNIQSQINLGRSIGEAMQFLNTQNSYGQDVFSPMQKHKLTQGFYGVLFEAFSVPQMNSLGTTDEKLGFVRKILDGSAEIKYKDPSTQTDISVPASILDIEDRNAIARMLTEQLKHNVIQQKETEERRFTNDVVAGKAQPAPKKENYIKAINTGYKSFKQEYGLENIGSADIATIGNTTNAIVGFIGKTRVITSDFKQDLEAWQNSGNPILFKMASDIVGFIHASFPELSSKLNSKSLAESLTMYQLTKAGVPVDQAYAMIVQNFWKTDAETRKQKQAQFEKLKTTTFSDLSLHSFGSKAEENEYKKQLELVAEQLFIQGADINVAKTVAENVLSSHWGTSMINGQEAFVALPPEKYYAMEGFLTPKNMLERLNDYVKDYVDDVNNILVVADDQTYNELYGEAPTPSYALYDMSEGYPVIVLNDAGQQVRVGRNIWRTEPEQHYEQLGKELLNLDVEIASLWKEVHDENKSVSLPYGMSIPYKKESKAKLEKIKTLEKTKADTEKAKVVAKQERDRRLVLQKPGVALAFNKATINSLIRE